jgi:hypothetical protein
MELLDSFQEFIDNLVILLQNSKLFYAIYANASKLLLAASITEDRG